MTTFSRTVWTTFNHQSKGILIVDFYVEIINKTKKKPVQKFSVRKNETSNYTSKSDMLGSFIYSRIEWPQVSMSNKQKMWN